MRIALISTLELAEDGEPRAFLDIAGESLARRQLEQALTLGCERIICEVAAMPAEVLSLQHTAEQAGAKFHPLRRLTDMASVVTAKDELLVMADGAYFSGSTLHSWASSGQSIAAFPADAAISAGFERIDAEWGWAGVMLIPGRLVEQLSHLPPDAQPMAALLRIALQSRIKTVSIDTDVLSDKEWALPANDEQMLELEELTFQRRLTPASFWRPIQAVSDRLAIKFGGSLFSRGASPVKFAAASVGLIGAAAAGGWWLAPELGLVVTSLAAFVTNIAGSLSRLKGPAVPRVSSVKITEYLIDITIITLSVLAAPSEKSMGVLFAAIMLIGLLRLSQLTGLPNFWKFARERFILALILATAVQFGALTGALQLLATITLATVGLHINRAKLTRT